MRNFRWDHLRQIGIFLPLESFCKVQYCPSSVLSGLCFKGGKYLVNHHALPRAPKIVSDLSALAYHGMIGNTIQSLIENGSDFFKINLDFYVFIKKFLTPAA